MGYVTFDLSQTNIPKNKRIWVIWVLNKKNFTDTQKTFFEVRKAHA